MNLFNGGDVGIIGRNKNAVKLDLNTSVVLTTDILKHNSQTEHTSIELNGIEDKITALSKDILLSTIDSKIDPQSIVYGERLVELLQWMIEILKTHTHPPNAPPINTFFTEANRRSSNMNTTLLNNHIKTN